MSSLPPVGMQGLDPQQLLEMVERKMQEAAARKRMQEEMKKKAQGGCGGGGGGGGGCGGAGGPEGAQGAQGQQPQAQRGAEQPQRAEQAQPEPKRSAEIQQAKRTEASQKDQAARQQVEAGPQQQETSEGRAARLGLAKTEDERLKSAVTEAQEAAKRGDTNVETLTKADADKNRAEIKDGLKQIDAERKQVGEERKRLQGDIKKLEDTKNRSPDQDALLKAKQAQDTERAKLEKNLDTKKQVLDAAEKAIDNHVLTSREKDGLGTAAAAVGANSAMLKHSIKQADDVAARAQKAVDGKDAAAKAKDQKRLDAIEAEAKQHGDVGNAERALTDAQAGERRAGKVGDADAQAKAKALREAAELRLEGARELDAAAKNARSEFQRDGKLSGDAPEHATKLAADKRARADQLERDAGAAKAPPVAKADQERFDKLDSERKAFGNVDAARKAVTDAEEAQKAQPKPTPQAQAAVDAAKARLQGAEALDKATKDAQQQMQQTGKLDHKQADAAQEAAAAKRQEARDIEAKAGIPPPADKLTAAQKLDQLEGEARKHGDVAGAQKALDEAKRATAAAATKPQNERDAAALREQAADTRVQAAASVQHGFANAKDEMARTGTISERTMKTANAANAVGADLRRQADGLDAKAAERAKQTERTQKLGQEGKELKGDETLASQQAKKKAEQQKVEQKPDPAKIVAEKAAEKAAADKAAQDKLAKEVSANLPPGTDATARARMEERAKAFAKDAQELSKPGGTVENFTKALDPKVFGANPKVEIKGVAADNKYESTQIHATQLDGKKHVFTRDSEGKWQSRPDLAAKEERGQVPLSAPGRHEKPNGTQTFATATAKDGKAELSVTKDLAKNFEARPIARQREVGERVQVRSGDDKDLKMKAGAKFEAGTKHEFGTIKSYDGKGNWQVEVDGADGKKRMETVKDADLRAANNPNFVTPKDAIHGATFDPSKGSDKEMMDAWHASPQYQALQAKKPGPDATPEQKAAYEKEAIKQAVSFVGESMRYPRPSPSDVKEAKDGLKTATDSLAADDANKKELAELKAQKKPDQARIKELEGKLLSEKERAAAEGAKAYHQSTLDRTAEAQLQKLDDKIKKLETDKAALTDKKDKDQVDAQIAKAKEEQAKIRAQMPGDKHYADHLQDPKGNVPIGDYFKAGTGQCRHMAVMTQALLQDAGVDARLTWGAAQNDKGQHRATHLWQEAQLSNGEKMIVDGTWKDYAPLEQTYNEQPYRKALPGYSDTYKGSLTQNKDAPSPFKRIDINGRESMLA